METQKKTGERKRAKKRGNRHGNIYKKGRTYYVRWMVDGQSFKRSLHTANKHDAEVEADRVLAAFQTRDRAEVLTNLTARLGDAKEEIRRIEDARPALRLANMFDAFRANPNRPQGGARTLEGYRAQAGRFVAWIAAHYPDAVEMRHVTGEMAAAFLDELARSNSPNTYNKYAALLRLIWRTLGTAARCELNPWEGVRRKEQPHTNGRRALTVEELRRVCLPLTGELRLLFAVGLYTGLRLGDCALLDWGAVDMVRRVIVTVPRKTARTGREVEIPLHPELYGMLAETLKAERRGYVMPTLAAEYRRDPGIVSRKVQGTFSAAEIETQGTADGYGRKVAKVGFHSLRHSFVSLMGNSGAPLALVQSIVGHSNPMMTAHYFHAQTDALANAVGNLPRLTGETIDAETADAPTDTLEGVYEREDGGGCEDVPPDGGARLQAFKAAFSALQGKERAAALRWVRSQTAKRLK